MSRCAWVVALGGLAVGCLAEWSPVKGVQDLDTLELALHKVVNASLTKEQRTLAMHVVGDIESVVTQLKTDKKLSKAQRLEKVKGAIQKMQNLQAQWQLASVETALKKLADLPHLSPEQRAASKKVVADVDSTVEEIESGKLTGGARDTRVLAAIKELQGLEKEWPNASTASRVEALQKEIDAKKALLTKEEAELKLVNLQKELLEKKMMLKKLTAEKDQTEALEKQRKEDEAQQKMVSTLIGVAKTLAEEKKSPTAAQGKAPVAGKVSNTSGISVSAIVKDLEAREHTVEDALARMDAKENKREAELSTSIKAEQTASAKGETETTQKAQKMLKMLLKQSHHIYLKARAPHESERRELQEGISSVKKGDVAALTKLLNKMGAESKSMEARAKNFLY